MSVKSSRLVGFVTILYLESGGISLLALFTAARHAHVFEPVSFLSHAGQHDVTTILSSVLGKLIKS